MLRRQLLVNSHLRCSRLQQQQQQLVAAASARRWCDNAYRVTSQRPKNEAKWIGDAWITVFSRVGTMMGGFLSAYCVYMMYHKYNAAKAEREYRERNHIPEPEAVQIDEADVEVKQAIEQLTKVYADAKAATEADPQPLQGMSAQQRAEIEKVRATKLERDEAAAKRKEAAKTREAEDAAFNRKMEALQKKEQEAAAKAEEAAKKQAAEQAAEAKTVAQAQKLADAKAAELAEARAAEKAAMDRAADQAKLASEGKDATTATATNAKAALLANKDAKAKATEAKAAAEAHAAAEAKVTEVKESTPVTTTEAVVAVSSALVEEVKAAVPVVPENVAELIKQPASNAEQQQEAPLEGYETSAGGPVLPDADSFKKVAPVQEDDSNATVAAAATAEELASMMETQCGGNDVNRCRQFAAGLLTKLKPILGTEFKKVDPVEATKVLEQAKKEAEPEAPKSNDKDKDGAVVAASTTATTTSSASTDDEENKKSGDEKQQQ